MTQGLFSLVPAVFFALMLAAGPARAAAGQGSDLTELAPEQLMKIEVETVSTASRFEQKVTEAPSSVSVVTA